MRTFRITFIPVAEGVADNQPGDIMLIHDGHFVGVSNYKNFTNVFANRIAGGDEEPEPKPKPEPKGGEDTTYDSYQIAILKFVQFRNKRVVFHTIWSHFGLDSMESGPFCAFMEALRGLLRNFLLKEIGGTYQLTPHGAHTLQNLLKKA